MTVYVVLEHYVSETYVAYVGCDVTAAEKEFSRVVPFYRRSLQVWQEGKKVFDSDNEDNGKPLPWEVQDGSCKTI